MRITSLRLDAESTALVNRIAREEGKSRSEVLREALTDYGKRRKTGRAGRTLSERLKPYIGKTRSDGRETLSENTGEKFYQMLLEERQRMEEQWLNDSHRRRTTGRARRRS